MLAKSGRWWLAAGLLAGLLAADPLLAARWYVDLNAAGANNGTSWSDACVSLTNALTHAAVGDEIWVAQGTYKPPANNTTRTVSFAITQANLTLLGGFTNGMSAASQRDPAAYPTILSGDLGTSNHLADNTFNVIVVTANGLTLDGFTISHGYASGNDPADRGGGLNVSAGYALGSLRNCRFLNNHARYGGAFIHDTVMNFPLVVSNCLFVGNGADRVVGGSHGGAVYLRYCRNPRFTDCGFYANASEAHGSAIVYSTFSLAGTGLFQRCVFAGNLGQPRDGRQDAYIMAPIGIGDNTRGDFQNCLFIGNCSWFGGVFHATATANNFIGIRLLHCTAADNLGAYGGVFHLNRNSGAEGVVNVAVSNSILRSASWFHNYGDSAYFYNSSTCRVAYVNLNGFSSATAGYGASLLADDGGNQPAADPLFATNLWSGTWSANATVDTNACRVTLTDNSRTWPANGLVGAFVRPVHANLDLAQGYTRALQFAIVSNDATTITAWYSPAYTGVTATLLAGASYSVNDYHLRSRRGRWTAQGWTNDWQQSPAIDAGSPLDSFASEPAPHGGRVNLGAYGNTPQASRSPPLARLVRVEQMLPDGVLHLAEVQAFAGGINVARPNGSVVPAASQDSTFSTASAGRAIDGDSDGNYWNGSVSHTGGLNGYAWWEVDLQQNASLTAVSIVNRSDAAPERIVPSRLLLLDAGRNVVWEGAITNAAASYGFDTTQPSLPWVQNFLRNATFQRCTNPGNPDFWGTDVPLRAIPDIAAAYGVDDAVTAPVAGARVLRADNAAGISHFRVFPTRFTCPLPAGPYTYSVYLRCTNATPASPRGWRVANSFEHETIVSGNLTTPGWTRLSLTFTLTNGTPFNLNPYLYVSGADRYHLCAPMLERGGETHAFVPALEDSRPDPPPRGLTAVPSDSRFWATVEYDAYTSAENDPFIRLRLVSAFDQNADVSVACTNNGQPVALSVTNLTLLAGGRQIVAFTNNLPTGDNRFTIRARIGGSLAGVAERTVPRRAAGVHEVRMDRFRQGMRINGTNFQPLSISSTPSLPAWLADELQARHFNTLVGVGLANFDPVAATNQVGPALARGMRVIFGPALAGAKPANWSATLAQYTNFIAALRGNPSILAWWPLDEPSASTWSAADVQAVYNAVKAADPYRPCLINWCDIPMTIGNEPLGTLAASDVYAYDHYPLGYLSPASFRGMANWTTLSRCVGESARLAGKNPAAWIQSYGYGDAWREPTPDELHVMAFHSLLYGTTVMYFGGKLCATGTWERAAVVNDQLLRVAREIFAAEGAVELIPAAVSNDITHSLWRVADQLYVLAANAHSATRAIAIDLNAYGTGRYATSWFENNRPVSVTDNRIAEDFAPYQTRVYAVTLAGTMGVMIVH